MEMMRDACRIGPWRRSWIAAFALILVPVVAVCLVPAVLVNLVVPDPYMDEIFHIPQAQRYCRGEIRSWDPMITTFPGLYILSLGFAATVLPLARWTNMAVNLPALCSSAVLRSVNILLGVVCCILFQKIVKQIEPGMSSWRASAKAVVMALYPLHWFFMFLYYTDVGSTTAVMAMYLASLRRSFWVSALLGAIAIIFRQTNVVWVVFATCTGLLDMLDISPTVKAEGEVVPSIEPPPSLLNVPVVSARLRRRRGGSLESKVLLSSSGQFAVQAICEKNLAREVQELLLEAWCMARLAWLRRNEVFLNFFPLAAVIASFIIFVIYNGGIVVGAKEAHEVSPHFPQLLYFGLLTATVLIPVYTLSPGGLRHGWSRTSYLCCTLACVAALCSVHFFTLAHPYLLADNRHYTFYIWKKLFGAHWSVKYLLIPAYVLSWSAIIHHLGKTKSRLWVLVFVLGVAAALIPAPLVEFRYFTVPFYIAFLHTHAGKRWGGLAYFLMGAAFMVLNVATFYVFLFRPFQWAHESGVQRFLWYNCVHLVVFVHFPGRHNACRAWRTMHTQVGELREFRVYRPFNHLYYLGGSWEHAWAISDLPLVRQYVLD